MAPSERSEGHRPADKPNPEDEGFALIAKPYERPQFTQTPDGGFTLFLKGEIYVAYRPPAHEASESSVQPETGGTVPLPESSEPGRSESRVLHTERSSTTDAQAPQEPAKSPVPDENRASSGLVLEGTSPAAREPHSTDEKPSWEKPRSEFDEIPESENRKFQLVGNPARKLGYRVTRKSNTRIADVVLATHPDQETTEYWRIRAFGDQAEKVRDQVQVGQKGVETTVYGPKYWKGRKKSKAGWEDTLIKGYHSGFVKVPKQYRSQEQAAETPQQQQ